MIIYESDHEAKNLKFNISRSHCVYYPLHFHRHLEINYCLAGRSDFEINNIPYSISKGSASVIFPYQLHQFKAGDSLGHYLSTLINLDYIDQYSNVLLSTLPETPVITADKLPIGFHEQFIQAYNMHVFSGTFHSEISGALLSAIVGELLTSINLIEVDKKSHSRMTEKSITRILDFCTQNATQDISLETVANALFLNKHYISHIFSDKIGVPFNTFINTHRISKVCTMLKTTNKDVLDIAYECGFHNQGTFNRVFKQHMKISPSEYRNSIRL